MLSPDSRQTIVDALRPPPGYSLDLAVGTTYSLNLDAALAPAAAFAIGEASAVRDDKATLEPIELLDAIRKHSRRITIFFQAGQIPVVDGRQLYTFLEGSLIPAAAPKEGGIFHPKVWAVRYAREDGEKTYRLLCSSRNLTHDRSWDTLLRLDSASGGSKSKVKPNGAAKFIGALPDLALTSISPERQAEIAEFAEELKKVSWHLPAPFESAGFHPLGLPGSKKIRFDDIVTRMAVISPFLTSGFLKRLPEASSQWGIVSRSDQLDLCAAAAVEKFGDETWVLDPDATPSDETQDVEVSRTTDDDPGFPLRGLHAKLIVTDHGRTSRILTGSANATSAAFDRNVEFVTELIGPSKDVGVRPLLAEAKRGTQSFSSFLMHHTPDEACEGPEGGAVDELDRLRHEIARVPLTARAVGAHSGDDFTLEIESDAPLPKLPKGVTWRTWPITLSERASQEVKSGEALKVSFPASFQAITSFFANELELEGERTRFVLCANLVEAPENREARTLRLILENSERLIRYLLMLLSDEREDVFSQLDILAALSESNASTDAGRTILDSIPLLEVMLRALAKDPKRLEDVNRLIVDLEEIAEDDPEFDKHHLLDDLKRVWSPIWAEAEKATA